MDDPLAFAIHIAQEAGDLLRGYFNPIGIPASSKPDFTVVTEADLASDRLVTAAIRSHYPGDEVISEESSHHLHRIGVPTWVIDPLDGTTNFSLGLSIWGISIARIIDGYTQLAVIYFPLLSELYTAARGSGAFLNDSPISVHPPDPAHPLSFFACCSRTFRFYDVSIPYKPRILGSSAYSYCMVARGTALLGFDATPKIWDIAAIWLLVEAAGGKITPFAGQPPFPLSSAVDFSVTNYPTLAAATPELLVMGTKKIQPRSKQALPVQGNAPEED